jgi:hypothetical protein
MDIAISINRIPIRMTNERWYHITNKKPYFVKKEIIWKQ